jgi:hypothetical protein
MENVISLYLDKERIYFTGVSLNGEERFLERIGATEEPILFDDAGNILHANLRELANLINPSNNLEKRLEIIYPAEYSLISSIPYSEEITPEDLTAMLDLETGRAYPGKSPDDFEYDLYLVKSKKIVAVITPQEYCNEVNQLFSRFNIQPKHKFNNNIYSLNSYLGAYPERKDKKTIVIGLQNNTANLNILHHNHIIFSEDIPYSSRFSIASVLASKITELFATLPDIAEDEVYLYGSELYKNILDEMNDKFAGKTRISRLNPFKLCGHKLSQREIDYTVSTMHLFPACIGAIGDNHLS